MENLKCDSDELLEVRRAEVQMCGLLVMDGVEEPQGPESDGKPRADRQQSGAAGTTPVS